MNFLDEELVNSLSLLKIVETKEVEKNFDEPRVDAIIWHFLKELVEIAQVIGKVFALIEANC